MLYGDGVEPYGFSFFTEVKISPTIEALQFFFMRGFSELDDVMHNTLGCLIGFGFMIILRIIFKTRYNNV